MTITDLVSALYDADVRSADDLEQAMGEPMQDENRKRLDGAAELALFLGFLPKRRPCAYGAREPETEIETETVPGLEPWACHAYPSRGACEVADGLYYDTSSCELSRENRSSSSGDSDTDSVCTG